MNVRIPGGECVLRLPSHVEHPTWTWQPGYGFLHDRPAVVLPRDVRREGRR